MDGKVPKRSLEYEVVPFAGGPVERVEVMAEHRALGFSLAAAKARDPNDVWKVRILRDNGVFLDPEDVDASQNIPLEHDPIIRHRFAFAGIEYRNYVVAFDLFGHCEADEGIGASGRWNSFAAAALASDAVGGNDVLELWIYVIGEQEVDVTKKYGGITIDLHDKPLWPWEAMPRRPAP